MSSGEVECQSHVVVGGREITDIQRDRTRREEERVQKREQVILRASISDETLDEPACLIAKSLQQENARVVAIEHGSLVELIEDDVRRPSRHDARANQGLEVSSRTGLVSQNVQRKTDESAADRHIETIGRLGCNAAELLGQTEGTATLARAEAMGIESPYRSQPVPGVVHDLGKLERLRQRGGYFPVAARVSMREGVAKREIQAHVAAWVAGHLTSEACNGWLDSCATFRHQRQVHPQRHGGRGERHANADIAAPREGPVEGRAQVISVGSVYREPLGGGPRLYFGVGMLEEVSIVLGVASREVVQFGALDELLARVGARRLEQTIVQARAADIRRHE